jgi:hypothetical protein
MIDNPYRAGQSAFPRLLPWSAKGTGTISSTPIGGGATTVLAGGQVFPQFVAVDFCFVNWTDILAGTVNRVNKQGEPPRPWPRPNQAPTASRWIPATSTGTYWDTFKPNGAVFRKVKS